MPEYAIFVRDDTERIAQIDDYQHLDVVLRFADIGTWVLDMEAVLAKAAGLTFGTRLEVLRDGEPLISGPLDVIDRNRGPNADRFTAAGVSDLTHLAERLAMPKPANAWTSDEQGVFESEEITFDVRSGAAETVMHQFVDVNAGPSARPERRVPGLVLGTDRGRGKQITGRARFQTLLALLQDASLASGGDFGLTVVQDGPSLSFEVLESVDRGLVFSDEHGNLAGFTSRRSRPKATAVLVGGSTPPGNSRRLFERLDPRGILTDGRIETFLDRSDSPTGAELNQAAEEAFATGVTVQIEPAAVEGLAFDRDYFLGDIVTVVVDGEPIVQAIREIRIAVSDDEQITPVVGTPGASGDPEIFSEVRESLRRGRDIQRLSKVESA